MWIARAIIALLAAAASLCPQAADVQAGKASYERLCQQCHGDDGDLLGYAGIVPIAGIKRRYPADVIGQLSGAVSGRVLHGQDRDQMVAFLSTLRGSKNYPDPGWLMTPQMLERKAPRIHEFRVLDARGQDDYAAGHVTNAVRVEPGACLAGAEETARWLGQLGVSPSTVVVVYDETGGPASACLWWRIRRAGHEWVAVLDGGWRRWMSERRFTTTVDPALMTVRRLHPTNYPIRKPPVSPFIPVPEARIQLGHNGWNWRRTLDDEGFRQFDVLAMLAQEAGLRRGVSYRVGGDKPELAHLAFVLHLLGYAPTYDSVSSVLTIE